MYKRIVSLVLCLLICCTSLFATPIISSAKSGLGLNDGISALRDQFQFGVGATVSNKMIDYYYYSPADFGDTGKYPLVVWLHGLVSGGWPGRQITKNDISYWASTEFQARFTDAGGAYILAPRSPEAVSVWGDDLVIPLKKTIDYFIQKNYENIDTRRIYIGGLSMGGKMTMKMIAAYPGMFAAAFPCSPYYTPGNDIINGVNRTPIWQLSSKTDCYMSYSGNIKPNWDRIMAAHTRPEDCRISIFETPYKPDMTRPGTTHDTWYACTYDMFMEDNGSYYLMSTYDGYGNPVTLKYPKGIISWLSRFRSDYVIEYTDVDSQSAGAIRVAWAIILALIANIAKSLGLVGILG